MPNKKIVIYVEGQTEQILLNQLIKEWWNFSQKIRIENIKLVNDLKNPIPNHHLSEEYEIFFLIINVEGSGHFNSAIAQRANKQTAEGYKIIGLLDLDYQNLNQTHQIQQSFKIALKALSCKNPENIELFLAIISIESWLLAFTPAVSIWAAIPENQVLDIIKKANAACDLEKIRSPAFVLSEIGKNRGKDHKNHHEVMSLVSRINREMISNVNSSSLVPSFNRFWNRLILLSEES
jgi:hypothetical protein